MLLSTERIQNKKFKSRSHLIGNFICDECETFFKRKISKKQLAREVHFCKRTCSAKFQGRKNKDYVHSNEWKEHMSIRNSGEGNPFFGKKHSQETLKKIQKSKQEKILKDPNAYRSCGPKKDVSGVNNAFYGKKHTLESRERMSRSRASGIAEGRIYSGPRGLHGTYTSKKTGIIEHYDSTWELLRMNILDVDPCVLSWTKKHGIRIQYLDRGKMRNYVPDFLIQEHDRKILEEIKGYEDSERKKLKIQALEHYGSHEGYHTSVLTNKELDELAKVMLAETLASFYRKVKISENCNNR